MIESQSWSRELGCEASTFEEYLKPIFGGPWPLHQGIRAKQDLSSTSNAAWSVQSAIAAASCSWVGPNQHLLPLCSFSLFSDRPCYPPYLAAMRFSQLALLLTVLIKSRLDKTNNHQPALLKPTVDKFGNHIAPVAEQVIGLGCQSWLVTKPRNCHGFGQKQKSPTSTVETDDDYFIEIMLPSHSQLNRSLG